MAGSMQDQRTAPTFAAYDSPPPRDHPSMRLSSGVQSLIRRTATALLAAGGVLAAAPGQAPILFSFNSSMLYAGTALGAAVGGLAGASWGHANLAWVGAGFAVLASLSFMGRRQ